MARQHVLRRSAALSGLAAAALLAVTACGSATGAHDTNKLAPADAVRSGLRTVVNGNATTLTLKLDASADQLLALQSSDGSTVSASARTLAKVLDGGSVTIALKTTGKSFAADLQSPGSAGKTSLALAVNAGDQPNLVQLDVVDKVLYARADVKKIASYAGADGEKTLQQFSSGGIATKNPFVARGIAGDWLKLNLNDLEQFAKGVAPSSTTAITPAQIQGLTRSLTSVYAKDVQVTRASADPARGDHLVLTGNTRALGTDLVAALKSNLGSIPGLSSLLSGTDTSSLPPGQAQLDAYVKDGAVDALVFNLTPYLKPAAQKAVGSKPIDIELDISRAASVSAPSDATEVNTGALLGLLGGLRGSLGSGGSGSATSSPVS